MTQRGFEKNYNNPVEIPVKLAKNQEYGIAIDSVSTDLETNIVRKPKSHQIIRITHDKENDCGVIHYSVRHHALRAPDNVRIQYLLDVLHSPQIKKQSGRVIVNKLFPEVMKEMNPGIFKGFYMGQWDSSITHYMRYSNLLVDSHDYNLTTAMMTELITPTDAISRIRHDPFNENLDTWCKIMAKQARKRQSHAQDSITTMTQLINRATFLQALENDTPGIYRYVPQDKTIPCDKDGYVYRSMHAPISDEALETAVFPATKCDTLLGAVNIASLANLKVNGPGIFSDRRECIKENPFIFQENNENMDDFLNAAALFLTIGYRKSIHFGIKQKMTGMQQ